jgi:hypothetical protein
MSDALDLSQPKPVAAPDAVAVWPLVIADAAAYGGVYAAMVPDMLARHEQGMATYGVPLVAHNGRDALRDAYAEVLDACIYLRQACVEQAGSDDDWSKADLAALYQGTLHLAACVRRRITQGARP